MSTRTVTPIERPQSLCDIAVISIRDAIVSGAYQLGEPLSEVKLVESLGISKTPIREALSILRKEGLVQAVPHKGVFVFSLSASELVQLGNYRFVLESAALDMAMSNDPECLMKDLLHICASMEKARNRKDTETYLRLDAAFHEAIFTHCGNQYLYDGSGFIKGKLSALRTHLSSHSSHMEKSYSEHLAIAESIRSGDVETARSTLFRHVTRGERSYEYSVEDIAKVDND